AFVLAGVELADLPANAKEALEKTFVVQLEVRETETTNFADVLLPVAPPVEKGGTFVNWEGRMRPFGQVLTSTQLPDRRVLNDLSRELGVELGLDTLAAVVAEYAQVRFWDGQRAELPNISAVAPELGGGAVLATWKQLLDGGSLQSFEPHLANTARKPVAVLSNETAKMYGVRENLEITGPNGSLQFAVATAQMPDGVVWVPQNAVGLGLHQIGVKSGDRVGITNVEVTK
ncbi:MAG: molybdopterin-dependent oxidoreductase, partial [Arcanobacterium sp.]|nr:molybdopterin-dependent oxidoreductase [Arcanobacterium sp.]